MRITIAFLLFGGSFLCGAEPDAQVSFSADQIAEMAVAGEGLLGLSQLSPESKEAVSIAIRSRIHEREKRPDRFLTALINLGDTNAMLKAMELRGTSELFAVRVMGNTLQQSCDQPQFISFLASDLLIDEPSRVRRVHGDIVLEPRSVDAAKIMRQIIVRSSGFPASVRAWADQLDYRNREHIRYAMRKWWAKNSAYVADGQYSKTESIESD